MNGDGSEKIDDGTVDGAPPRAGICRCFALTHCRSAGIKPILKCLLFCPYRNTVREHDPNIIVALSFWRGTSFTDAWAAVCILFVAVSVLITIWIKSSATTRISYTPVEEHAAKEGPR